MMLAGTMGTVDLFIRSNMPNRLSDRLVAVLPSVKWLIIALALFAGLVSAFVDNVATVLMLAPVGLAISKKLNISPVQPHSGHCRQLQLAGRGHAGGGYHVHPAGRPHGTGFHGLFCLPGPPGSVLGGAGRGADDGAGDAVSVPEGKGQAVRRGH